jgi:hypothetical protein
MTVAGVVTQTGAIASGIPEATAAAPHSPATAAAASAQPKLTSVGPTFRSAALQIPTALLKAILPTVFATLLIWLTELFTQAGTAGGAGGDQRIGGGLGMLNPPKPQAFTLVLLKTVITENAKGNRIVFRFCFFIFGVGVIIFEVLSRYWQY